MKYLKYIGHPHLLILSFFLIMISGEHWGGFYLLYLLFALPHGAMNSILAVLGIGMLVLAHNWLDSARIYRGFVNFAGALCLIMSLFLFFHNDRDGYNDGTFYLVVPILSLAVFSLILLAFFINIMIDIFAFKRKSITS